MGSFAQTLLSIVTISVCSVLVRATEVCVYEDRYKVCDHGCCSRDCCMSPYQIAGIVFGALAFICLIAALVLYCVKRQKRKGRVVGDGGHTRVMVVNGYSQPIAYSTAQPFAPGYSASYGHPGVPPPYSANPGMPPPQYTGYAAMPPPPAYSYNDAAKNPFASASSNAFATQSLGAGGSNPAGM